MLLKLSALGLLAIGLVQAQQPSEAQLNKLYSQMDEAMGLRPGVTIADIGTGFAIEHALRIAEKVAPGGKVVCVDVRQSVIAKINAQADARHVTNVEAVLGTDDDPKLSPAAFDPTALTR